MIKCIISQSYVKDRDLVFEIYFSIKQDGPKMASVPDPTVKELTFCNLSSKNSLCCRPERKNISCSSSKSNPDASKSNSLNLNSTNSKNKTKANNLVQINRTYSQLLELRKRLLENYALKPYLDIPEPPNLDLYSDLIYLERKKDQMDRWLELICLRLDLKNSKEILMSFLLQKDLIVNPPSETKTFSWFKLPFKEAKGEAFYKNYKSLGDYIDWNEDLFYLREKHSESLKKAYTHLKNALEIYLSQVEDLSSTKTVMIYDLKELFEHNFINTDQGYNSSDESVTSNNKNVPHQNILRNLGFLSQLQKVLNQRDMEMVLFQKSKIVDPVSEIAKFGDCYANNLNTYKVSLAKYDHFVSKLAEIDAIAYDATSKYSESSPKLLKITDIQLSAKYKKEDSEKEFFHIESRLNVETFYFEKFRYCMLQKILSNYIKSQANNARKNLSSLKKALTSLRKNSASSIRFKPSTRIGELMLAQENTIFPKVESFKDTKIRRIGYYKASGTLSLDAKVKSHAPTVATGSLSSDNAFSRKNIIEPAAIIPGKFSLLEGNLCEPINPRYEYELNLNFYEQSLFKASLVNHGLLPKKYLLCADPDTILKAQPSKPIANSNDYETQAPHNTYRPSAGIAQSATTSTSSLNYSSLHMLKKTPSNTKLAPYPSISSISAKTLSLSQHSSPSLLNKSSFDNHKNTYDYRSYHNNAAIN